MGFLAGPYQATYKSLAVGQLDDGFEFEYGAKVQDIISDIFPSREDGVFQGVEAIIRGILNEPTKAGALALTWPWDSTRGQTGVIGRLMTAMAGPLILTKCTGTTASPTSLTFPRAVIWTDKVNSRFNSSQRKVPVVIAALPVPLDDSGDVMGCLGGYLYTST